MPGGISAGDRKLLLVAAVVATVLMTITVVFAPSERLRESPVPSSYSSDSGGTLAAYLLLGDLKYNVHRWEDSPARLDASNAVLIIAEPTETPTDAERRALRAFVEHGGRLVFCGGEIKGFFKDADIRPWHGDPGWQNFTARVPSGYSRGAATLTLHPRAVWGKLAPEQTGLYGGAEGEIAVAWRMGAGEVMWWAGATPLTNSGIGRTGNLRLLLNAVAGAPVVYWDEYFHGQRTSLWAYVERTSIAWSLAQLGILALAVLFAFSRRWGPVFRPAPISRLSPLEFVDTLGGLYEHARATQVGVDVAYRRLRFRLARQLGMSSSSADIELARAAGERLGWQEDRLRAALAEAGSGKRLKPAAALSLIQEVEGFTRKLGVRRAASRESR